MQNIFYFIDKLILLCDVYKAWSVGLCENVDFAAVSKSKSRIKKSSYCKINT